MISDRLLVTDGRLTCETCGPVNEPECFIECVCACHDLCGAHGDCFCEDCMPVTPAEYDR